MSEMIASFLGMSEKKEDGIYNPDIQNEFWSKQLKLFIDEEHK